MTSTTGKDAVKNVDLAEELEKSRLALAKSHQESAQLRQESEKLRQQLEKSQESRSYVKSPSSYVNNWRSPKKRPNKSLKGRTRDCEPKIIS